MAWRMARRWALPLALALVVLVVGVAHATADGPGDPAPVDEPGLSPGRAAAARRAITTRVPVGQRAALADGRVTDDEYRAAVLRSMTCLEDAVRRALPDPPPDVITFDGPTRSVDGFSYSFGYRVADPDLDPRPLDRRCQAREVARVEDLFHLQRRTDRAYLARTAEQFHRCLDRASLPGDERSGPRARFVAILHDGRVTDRGVAAARRCIGRSPSIGDQDL